ncbi:MAG: hypothetical protein H0V60_06730, partial [Actinobacteria bacterium]|nr:hypothetical protein [Actinomycetota bacterium]
MRRVKTDLVTSLVRANANASTTRIVPAGVVSSVTIVNVPSSYRRSVVDEATGWIDQCPASGSSSLPNTEGESYRGKQSQSMDPLLDT